jgi:adenylate cyclase
VIKEQTTRRAVLFADVCDSTGIYESAGDKQALALINRLFGRLAKKVKDNGGAVVKTLGDGMVCQFEQPDGAFRAACEMQAAATGMPSPANQPRLEIKVAWTYGAVVARGDDVFGDTVNVCARLAALANPNQILTTQETVEALSPGLRKRCRDLPPAKLRGRAGQVKVSELLWRTEQDVTEVELGEALQARAAGREWRMKLTYAGAHLVLGAGDVAKLGRDKATAVVVASALASRVHARGFGREGNFVIADQSSNGTYLLVDGSSREICLRREEAVMGERGWIGLGKSAGAHGPHMVRYRLERGR